MKHNIDEMKSIIKTTLLSALLVSGVATASAYRPEKNPMEFGKNRLSIITPTLLRLEYAVEVCG